MLTNNIYTVTPEAYVDFIRLLEAAGIQVQPRDVTTTREMATDRVTYESISGVLIFQGEEYFYQLIREVKDCTLNVQLYKDDIQRGDALHELLQKVFPQPRPLRGTALRELTANRNANRLARAGCAVMCLLAGVFCALAGFGLWSLLRSLLK